MEECPICFLSYGAVNITNCCGAIICTECFLQVRPQKEKDSTCPFCSSENFSVRIAKKNNNSFSLVPRTLPSSSSLTTSSLSTTSSSTLSSNTGTIDTSITVNNKKKSTASVAPNTPPTKASRFGSELEKDESFKTFKKRSESFASTEGSSPPKNDKEIIESIAMTTEERQRLEEEMKAQHYHPLVLKIEAEAQERRMQNDRAYRYRRSTSGNIEAASNRRLRLRGGSTRNWDQLANFLEGEEIDDITALERVIMHSIGEGERGSRGNDNSSNGNTNSNADDDSNSNSNLEQQQGFPLLRSLLTGQMDINNGRAVGSSTAAGRSWTWNRRQRHPFMGSNMGAGLDVSLNTASLMGLSEEEQISMAIAASMRDQEQQSGHNDDDDTNDEDENVNNAIADGERIDVDAGDNSENDNSNTVSTADNEALGAGVGLVVAADPTPRSQQFKNEGNGDEASTITELARVVTDSRAPNVDTCGIAA